MQIFFLPCLSGVVINHLIRVVTTHYPRYHYCSSSMDTLRYGHHTTLFMATNHTTLFGLTPKQPNLFLLFTLTDTIHYTYVYFFFGFEESEYNIITSVVYIFFIILYTLCKVYIFFIWLVPPFLTNG
jgi:hypothetical protein